ncbi:MAG: ferredoxin--NADP reductase [Myxococcota bacterium]
MATVDPKRAGVDEAEWKRATASYYALRVREVVEETSDARSFVLDVPDELKATFAYAPGQFLSFAIPFDGKVLVRSYSLASSPHFDAAHKFTVKRIADGRVSNWMNDTIRAGDTLMVTPPAGLFLLDDADSKIVLFSGGSGITPVISIIKSALVTSARPLKLVYANRNAASIIFAAELERLARAHSGRFALVHSLDEVDGFLGLEDVVRHVEGAIDAEFYLCGPGAFMATVEGALEELGVHRQRIHVEHFASPPDPDAEGAKPAALPEAGGASAPASIHVALDGAVHEVPCAPGESVLQAARRAGLDPPFSCEEGYCSCCMAKLVEGEVRMKANDCLTPELLEEGWVLTCQSRCVSPKIRIEYPD